MTRALAVIGVLVILGAAIVVGRSLGLVQFGQAAPSSRIFVAVSRSDDETAAREIEVVDMATGERDLFDVGVRISALALSADRRTLLVGTDDRVLLLDPITGSRFAEIATRRPAHLVQLGETARVAVIHVVPDGGGGIVALIDTAARREISALLLASTPGRGAARDGALLVPGLTAAASVVVDITFDPIQGGRPAAVAPLQGRTISGAPQLALLADRSLAFLGPWESGFGGARLLLGVAGETPPKLVSLQVIDPTGTAPLRGLREVQTAMATAEDGTIHACLGNADLAARYRVDPRAGAAERVGTECGAFARTSDGTLALAVRGKPRLAVLDAAGRVTRSLALPGIPVAVAPN